MKKILFLSFYFEPDLCAGSFRNSPLAFKLAEKLKGKAEVHVFTTMPNRYSTFKIKAKEIERKGNIFIHRFNLPIHNNGFKDQIIAFKAYVVNVLANTKGQDYDLIYASSSRLFTAFLGAYLARRKKAVLFLDIRDIFKETIEDIVNNGLFKFFSFTIVNLIERYTFSKAKAINLVSEGFKEYFIKKAPHAELSFYPNGIDDLFLNIKKKKNKNKKTVITYAGNIGSGQGLEKTIPFAARKLGDQYIFKIIGSGGTLKDLEEEITKHHVSNIEIIKPIKRDSLIDYYNAADILFLQLNDLPAFKKVLPSKIFEYAAFSKPILAGVSGYSEIFLNENVLGSYIYHPGDWMKLVETIKKIKLKEYNRDDFCLKYSRKKINDNLANHIIKYLKL